MFEIPSKAHFLFKLHTKHRKDVKFQGLQNGFLKFLIFCNFDTHNFKNNFKNDHKIKDFQTFQNRIMFSQKPPVPTTVQNTE